MAWNPNLVLIKSEGDLDLTTPLYAMGVQGIFTRSLDLALLNNQIDLAVHSMKDVPVDLPVGITEAAFWKETVLTIYSFHIHPTKIFILKIMNRLSLLQAV